MPSITAAITVSLNSRPCPRGKRYGMLIIEFSGSRFSNQAILPERLDEHFVVQPQSPRRCVTTRYPADGPAHCWRWRSPEDVYPAIAVRSQQNADHRDYARGNFRVNMLLPRCPSFAEEQRRGTTSAPTKVSDRHNLAGCDILRRDEFVLSEDDGKLHTEGKARS